MLDQLVAKCANDITNGRIVVADDRSVGLAPTMRTRGPVDIIAANFAVLNHLDNLHAGLTELSGYLKPNGILIASFINPINIRDMRSLWWWRAALRDLTAGNITVRGDVTTYRYFMREVRRAAQPALRVTQITPGPPPLRMGLSRFAPLRLRTGALFVTMRKTAPSGSACNAVPISDVQSMNAIFTAKRLSASPRSISLFLHLLKSAFHSAATKSKSGN